MGFLDWWRNNNNEDQQLSLLGDSQSLARHERVDGAIVNKDFQASVKRASGMRKTYPAVIEIETEELFDCDVDTLYQETGGRKNDRSSLPKEAQKAYIANEIRLTHKLDQVSGTFGPDPDERHEHTCRETRSETKETRRWLSW